MFTVHRSRALFRTAVLIAVRALLITAPLLCPPAFWALDGTATITGTAQIIDGDTLDIDTTRIRLFGIDAPEPETRRLYPLLDKYRCSGSRTKAAPAMISMIREAG
jgi:endonuclease YncB( thermonuclease family)